MGQALELDPESSDLFDIRGIVKSNLGDYDGALADFDTALKINPQNAPAFFMRGVTRKIHGDDAGALTDWESAIAAAPDNAPRSRLHRQLILLGEGMPAADFADTVAGWNDGWVKTLGQFVAGKIDEAALLAAAGKTADGPAGDEQCVARYFIGALRLIHGDRAGARESFQKTIATGQKGSYVYPLARAELARLDSAGAAL